MGPLGLVACILGGRGGAEREAADVVVPATARRETHEELLADARAPRHPGDGGGRFVAERSPEPVVAAGLLELPVVYTAGPSGVAVGGSLVLMASPFWGWSPPQVSAPGAPGYTAVEAPAGVQLRPRSAAGQLWLEVAGRPLEAGDEVRFVYGAGQTARADRFAGDVVALWMGVDVDGDGVRALVEDPVRVPIVAGPPARVLVTLPSVGRPGEAAELVLAVVDAAGNAFGDESVTLLLRGAPSLELPASVVIDPTDAGCARVPVRAQAPGVYTVTVEGVGVPARSNPWIVKDDVPPMLWGDLQIHTGVSDGTGRPADVWRYARDVAGLDFAAITDHDHWGMRHLDGSAELRAASEAAAEAAHLPGRFVALHGYEYTHWLYGHRHVIYFDGPGPVLSSLDPATAHPRQLWAALAGRRALTIPHHVAGGPVALDWTIEPPPGWEPVVEIASVHGQSESAEGPGRIHAPVAGAFALDQLVAGRRFGFVGSTDGHDGHPGLAHLVGGRGGLAAVLTGTRTRQGIYDALRARHTYATNGPRIWLRVAVGDAGMGDVVAPGPAELTFRVAGTAPIARVELVQQGGVVGSRAGESPVLHGSFPLASTEAGAFAYVRVIQTDGGMAWSSPVFFGG